MGVLNEKRCKGEVSESGVFTYDFPIIESNCPEEVYKESRGNMNYSYDLPDIWM
jgi:hypothetical protein